MRATPLAAPGAGRPLPGLSLLPLGSGPGGLFGPGRQFSYPPDLYCLTADLSGCSFFGRFVADSAANYFGCLAPKERHYGCLLDLKGRTRLQGQKPRSIGRRRNQSGQGLWSAAPSRSPVPSPVGATTASTYAGGFRPARALPAGPRSTREANDSRAGNVSFVSVTYRTTRGRADWCSLRIRLVEGPQVLAPLRLSRNHPGENAAHEERSSGLGRGRLMSGSVEPPPTAGDTNTRFRDRVPPAGR